MKREIKFRRWDGSVFFYLLQMNADELKNFNCDDNDQMVFCPPCEFVHQLQNLYFTLTGNELKCAGLV